MHLDTLPKSNLPPVRTRQFGAAAPKSRVIRLPNDWSPRFYQLPTLQALDSGKKRIVSVWHRRSGKDNCALNYTACAAHRKVGVWWHILPTLKQARKTVWQGVDNDGRRIIDQAFPKELRRRTLEDEMLIEFKNGSFWQLVGGDNYDALVGANPRGVVFSEWALTDPRAWDYIEPILLANGGWAWWIFTPRGDNHAKRLFDMGQTDPDYYVSALSIDDTKVLTKHDMDRLRQQGRSEEHIQQEYYVSFTSSNEGAVYGKSIQALERAGKVTDVPYDAAYPVETWWDFGLRHATAILFVQRVKNEVRVIDAIVDRNKLLPYYLNEVNSRGYSYIRHVAPHDGGRVNYGTGQSYGDIALNHGIRFTQAPKLSVADGIEAAGALLSRCVFDRTRCAYSIKCLKAYHYKWDDETEVYSNKPNDEHWSADVADAFRTGAVTPEGWGVIPEWMRTGYPDAKQNEGASGTYDPLGAFR